MNTQNLKTRWVLLIFAFASGSEVAGQWCCAQIRPTSPAATLLSHWWSVRYEVGTGSQSPGTVYWAYVTLWGGYFVLISKWQDTHQKVKSLVHSHRTGRGWVWGVWLSHPWQHPQLEGGRGGRESGYNLHPHHSAHLSDAGHALGHSGHWRHRRISVPAFEEPIFSGVADSLFCVEHEKKSICLSIFVV